MLFGNVRDGEMVLQPVGSPGRSDEQFEDSSRFSDGDAELKEAGGNVELSGASEHDPSSASRPPAGSAWGRLTANRESCGASPKSCRSNVPQGTWKC